VNAYKLIS